jgi:hypothetical protein
VSTTSLPAGASCGSCHLFSICRSRFQRLPEDKECEHSPPLYRQAAPVLNVMGSEAPRRKPSGWSPSIGNEVARLKRRRIREALRQGTPFPTERGSQFLLFEAGGAA